MRVMKMRIPCLSPLTLLAVTFSVAAFLDPTSLRAGVVIEGEQDLGDEGPEMRSSVAISDGNARVDSIVGGEKRTMIFRSDKDLFWIVDESAKTYREITREDMRRVVKLVNNAMELMKEKMASMPPEQRKMMEKMMGNQLAALDGEKKGAKGITYEKIGNGGKVGGWSTVKYEGSIDGALVSEVWTAAGSAVNVGMSEMKTLEKMMSFFREFTGKFGGDSLVALGPEGALEGVPVKIVSYSNGAPAGTYLVTSIEQKKLPASEFEVPAGYTKESLNTPEMP